MTLERTFIGGTKKGKSQKGKLFLDPMVGTAIPYTDYLASIGGDNKTLLVGKSTELLGLILRGSTTLVPLTIGVGQMKPEARHVPRSKFPRT